MARRRRSPDKSLSRALRVLDHLVDRIESEPYATTAEGTQLETLSARMTALARATDVYRKVEESAWRTWSPRRLRELSDEELAAALEGDAARAAHRGPLQ